MSMIYLVATKNFWLFNRLALPLSPSPPSPPLSPSMNGTLSTPTSLALPASPPLGRVQCGPDTTTIVIPVLLATVLPPGISPVSDELQYTGPRCSNLAGHISTLPLAPLPLSPRLEAGIPDIPQCLMLVALPPYGGSPCDVIL